MKINRKKTPKDVVANLSEEVKSKHTVVAGEEKVMFFETRKKRFTVKDLRTKLSSSNEDGVEGGKA